MAAWWRLPSAEGSRSEGKESSGELRQQCAKRLQTPSPVRPQLARVPSQDPVLPAAFPTEPCPSICRAAPARPEDRPLQLLAEQALKCKADSPHGNHPTTRVCFVDAPR